MKNILLLVYDDAGQEARFQAALDITRALQSHLCCLDVTVLPTIIPEYYPEGGLVMLLAAERRHEAENGKRLQTRLAAEQVQWSWTDVTDNPVAALEKAADVADLIVLNRKLQGLTFPDMGAVTSHTIVNLGKPVIAVPPGADGFDAAGVAFVAWDGSPQASSALQAAVPLLWLTCTVVILEVDDGSLKAPAQEAASYLSRHDIHAVIIRRSIENEPVADTLLSEARAMKASYLVLGGFGHSRLVEAICGGVTRRMLAESPLPLVLTH